MCQGPEVIDPGADRGQESCEIAASFSKVTFAYPGETVPLIDNLDFKVRQGEFAALIGPSGCGKSTIFRLLNRLNEPLSGEIRTFVNKREDRKASDISAEIRTGEREKTGENGKTGESRKTGEGEKTGESRKTGEGEKTGESRKIGKIGKNGKRGKQKKSRGRSVESVRCGYMPQQDMLFPWRTVLENVRLPMELRGGFSEKEMNERAQEALKDVGLEGWGGKLPRELSGGMRQRASFARTLMTGADLLLLDEPFSALDYLTRLSMREWLLEQWEKDKKTVLFITHDVEEAIFLSTRILAVERSPVRVFREYRVPLPRPRTEASLGTPEALALKEQLIRLFREAEK